MQSLQATEWADIETLRARLAAASSSVEETAQAFATDLVATAPTVLLARVFLVMPFGNLPAEERRFGTTLVSSDPTLGNATPTLTLLGTAGQRPAWRVRKLSVGHRAIPLLGAAFVRNIPMIARLLSDLEVGIAGLDDGKALDTRRLQGGRNGAFFVPDARHSRDEGGRQIIPAKDFVDAYGVRTVFGMGGAYLDGTLAVAIVFTTETIDRLIVDRFPSLISNFKMATSAHLGAGRVFREASPTAT